MDKLRVEKRKCWEEDEKGGTYRGEFWGISDEGYFFYATGNWEFALALAVDYAKKQITRVRPEEYIAYFRQIGVSGFYLDQTDRVAAINIKSRGQGMSSQDRDLSIEPIIIDEKGSHRMWEK